MFTNNFNSKIFSTFFFLIPISSIFGKAITEVFFNLFLILFLFQSIKNKNFKLENLNIVYFFLFFYFYILLNSLIQIDHSDLNITAISYFRYLILLIAVHYFLNTESINLGEIRAKQIILKIILYIIIVIIIDSLTQFFLGQSLTGYKPNAFQISSFFNEEKILGTYLLYLILIFIWWIINFDFKISGYLLFFIISGGYIVIYLSGQRTAFFLLLILIFYNIIFVSYYKKIFVYSLLLLIFFISISAQFNIGYTDPFSRMFKKTFHQITNHKSMYFRNSEDLKEFYKQKKDNENYKESGNKFHIFSKDHHNHYILAKKLFLEKPVFGHGPRGFRYYCRKINYDSQVGMCTTHPHNFIMQFLSELGLFGIIFLLLFTYFIVKNFYMVIKLNNINKKLKNCFLLSNIGLVLMFFPFTPSGNFFSSSFSVVAYYMIGLYSYSLKQIYDNQ